MKNSQSNGIEQFAFEKFGFSNIPHGFFTRNGGISPAPWRSLNLSTTGGDSRENVIENRKRIFEIINRPVDSLFDAWQVHGNRIIQVNQPRGLKNFPEKADGLVTNKESITLFLRFADCVPILLYDPVKSVVGILHAGWKGTLRKIVKRGVNVFRDDYNSNVNDIVAGIGPSICAAHYEIKDDVATLVRKTFKTRTDDVLSASKSGIHFDLAKANQIILQQSGITKIEFSDICTACDTRKWFSHRAENGATGRFGAYIAVQ
jgi:YfiH family protein